MLFSGAKTRAEEYSWMGASSITDRLNKANRFASCTKAYRLGLSLALKYRLVRITIVIDRAYRDLSL
jgi:hypothetical protein